jgi:SAM-dependent methyltransferase
MGSAPATAVVVEERVECSFCGTRLDRRSTRSCVPVPCNVRAFKDEVFHVWRCRTCRSLHCLEIVDLARYYVNYPISKTLTPVVRVGLDNQMRRLAPHGLRPDASVLDYGCGYGVFLDFLRERGFSSLAGFDPYSAFERYRNPAALEAEYDFVVLQDVLEHVEEPRALLDEVDRVLRPGGRIVIGTPQAEWLSLRRPLKDWMQLHPPYHLHIYTAAALEALARERGWRRVAFFDRAYYDTKYFGLNARSADLYKWFHDGTLDSFLDPAPSARLWRSPRYIFLAKFGYWLKRRGEMAMVFEKPAARTPPLTRRAA